MLRMIAFVTPTFLAAGGLLAQDSTAAFVRFHAQASAGDSASITMHFAPGREDVEVAARPALDLTAVARAYVQHNDVHGYSVIVEFTEAGKQAMWRTTQALVDRRLAVVVDGTVRQLPWIRSPLRGPVPIADGFDEPEAAEELAEAVNARLRILRERAQ